MPHDPLLGQSDSRVYTIHVCSDCGEQITEAGYDPKVGAVWGHYHDPPEGYHDEDGTSGEDPWFDAVEVEVIPKPSRPIVRAVKATAVKLPRVDDLV